MSVLVSYNNWVDLPDGVWKSDNGTDPPGIPGSEENLRNMQRSSVWTGPAAVINGTGNGLGYDWGPSKKVQVIALLDHTFESLTSGNLFYRKPDNNIASAGQIQQLWESDAQARHAIAVLDQPVDAVGVFFSWNDTQPSEVVSASRLWAGDVLDLSPAIVGVSNALPQSQEQSESRGRQLTRNASDPRALKSISLKLDRVPPDLMWGDPNNLESPSVFDMLMGRGQSLDLLVLPATPEETRRRAVCGAISAPVRSQRFRSSAGIDLSEL